ncbi:MAG: hypothetical protein NTY65_09230 [Planctomycetota bacterium]|nr:hypothetical protein [Planctomycetota bacterium]
MRYLLLVLGLIALAGMSAAEQPQAVPPPSPAPATPSVAPQPTPEIPPGGCLYRGKPRTSAWVDGQFVKFRDKIAKIDGVWRDCGKGVVNKMTVEIASPPPGTEIRGAPSGSKVLTVINEAEILAQRPADYSAFDGSIAFPQIVFHVRGIETQGFTDGIQLTRFFFATYGPPEQWLVYCGTYAYIDTKGAKRTVPSYAVYRPATREEFVQALASGLTLTDYVVETKIVRPPKGSGESSRSVYWIVPKPVL